MAVGISELDISNILLEFASVHSNAGTEINNVQRLGAEPSSSLSRIFGSNLLDCDPYSTQFFIC